MTLSWLEPLLDPSSLVRSGRLGERSDERVGAALLLDGRFVDYMRISEQGTLPQLSESIEKETPTLLTALVAQIVGSPSAVAQYEKLAESTEIPSDLRAAAAVLGGVVLADASRHAEAVALLDGTSRNVTGLDRALLLLHMGLRSAEQADWEAALAATREAQAGAMAAGSDGEWQRTIGIIAEHNLAQFSFLAFGEFSFGKITPRSKSRLLARVDQLLVEGLGKYLSQHFDGFFADPRTSSIQFQPEDPVEARLYGALLRVECLADWDLQESVRRMIGRYRLLAAAGRPERQPENGFELLRRGRDKAGIERATRIYRQVGPLQPLREVGVATALNPWSPLEEGVSLVLLRQVADVLPLDAADSAVRRIISDMDELLRPKINETNSHLVIQALASVVRVAASSSHKQAGQAVLQRLPNIEDPLMLQRLPLLIEALDWTAISTEQKREWLEFAAAHLEEDGDLSFVVHAILRELARTEQEEVLSLLTDAFRDHPNVIAGSLLAEFSDPVPTNVRSFLVSEASAQLEQKRSEARSGSYSFGAYLDPALLLCWLILAQPSSKYWSRLERFLLDSRVAGSDKIAVLDVLARNVDKIPRRIRRSLAGNPKALLGHSGPIFGAGRFSEGAVLRFLLALGALDETEALTQLLTLASSAEAAERVEAARSIPFAAEVVPADALVTLAMGLAQDSQPLVRATAARSLAATEWPRPLRLSSLVKDRQLTLLRDQGSEAPRQLLDGLFERTQAGGSIEPDLMQAVRQLASNHLSAGVRFAAHRILQVGQTSAE
jgi:hypothetical protein